MVGGKFVYAAGTFSKLDEAPPPPAMPDWSPVRRFRGYAAWGEQAGKPAAHQAMSFCGCANTCNIHGHAHAQSWASSLPVSDLKSFWGALGCACWAV